MDTLGMRKFTGMARRGVFAAAAPALERQAARWRHLHEESVSTSSERWRAARLTVTH